MKRTLLILTTLVCTLHGFAQDITLRDRIVAEHIYNFGIYVNWKSDRKNDIKYEKFRIGVVGEDTSMFYLLKRICKYRLIKWKKIEVLHFKTPEDIQPVQILYVNRESNDEIMRVDEKIRDYSTLLITDSCNEFKGTMINFFPPKSLKKVEINKEMIKERGMTVNPLLFVIARNYEEDWEDMYQKSETQLLLEKEITEKQKQILAEQEKSIVLKQEQISGLSKDIDKKTSELSEKEKNLEGLRANIARQDIILSEKTRVLSYQEEKILNQQRDILGKQKLLSEQMDEYERQSKRISAQKDEIVKQQGELDVQNQKLNKSIAALKKQQLVLYFVLIVLVLILFLAVVVYRSYRNKKRANGLLKAKNSEIVRQNSEILQQKEEIETQRDEIEAQRDSLQKQRDHIFQQKKEITDSITYASRIQSALLPPELLVSQLFSEHFVYFRPRDIVSGDFYWFRKKDYLTCVAVADCTGHGVPGAFMSMLGIAFLNEIADRHLSHSAADLLNRLRDKIVFSLHQTGKAGGSKDGMDITMLFYNDQTHEICIAGANNPVYLIRHSDLIDIKGDKMPIGYHHGEEKPFTDHRMICEEGDVFYLFTDGYADQFGGTDGKKYKYNAFKEFLLEIHSEELCHQEKLLQNEHLRWKAQYEQVDDILVVGLKFR